jgi:hypothetical protein
MAVPFDRRFYSWAGLVGGLRAGNNSARGAAV